MMDTMTTPCHDSGEIAFSDYDTDGFFDEMFDGFGGRRGPVLRCWPAV